MARQMRLFPSRDDRDNRDAIPAEDLHAVDEMFVASRRFRSSTEYMALLHFISRFPKYSAFNCLLLFAQNPALSYVATAGAWNRQFNRRIKTNARSLIILAPMSPVRFVYDVTDTEGEPVPPNLISAQDHQETLPQIVYDTMLHNCRVNGIVVREISLGHETTEAPIPVTGESIQKYGSLGIDSQMDFLVLLNSALCLEDRYAVLVYELAQIFCGHHGIGGGAWWQDRRHEPDAVKEIEAESVSFLVCRRKRLFKSSEKTLSQYRRYEQQIPVIGLNTVLTATSYIEDMGKAPWKKPKKRGRQRDA